MNKKQTEDLCSRLTNIEEEFEALIEKIMMLKSLLQRTQHLEEYESKYHDPEIYREAVKLGELFCKKYGNLLPKDEF